MDDFLMKQILSEIVESWDEAPHAPTPEEEAVVSILLLIENNADDLLIFSNKYARADAAFLAGLYALIAMRKRSVPNSVQSSFIRKLRLSSSRLFGIPVDELEELMENRLAVFSPLIRNAKSLSVIVEEASLLFAYDLKYDRYVEFRSDSPVILLDFSIQAQIEKELSIYFQAIFPLVMESVNKCCAPTPQSPKQPAAASAPQLSKQPASQPPKQSAAAPPAQPKQTNSKKDGSYSWLPLLLCPVLFIAVLIFSIISVSEPPAVPKETAPKETVRQTVAPTAPKLNPVSTPSNGHVFERIGLESLAPFSVTAPSGSGIYVVMDPISFIDAENLQSYTREQLNSKAKSLELRFFVRGGRTVEMDVPLGKYHIYYATGDTWYGEEHLFGPDTRYYKCDETFDFTSDDEGYNGWTLTLTAVYNGNLDTDLVDAADFPK